MRDFLLIMQEHGYFRESRWDKTNSIYTFETGSQLEFFSVDQPEKVRGARRDRLFINECNNVSFAAFEELEVRTKEFVYLDWNPVSDFWYYSDVEGKRNDVEHIILTYQDNEALNPEIKQSIEQRKSRQDWWKVYGLGERGEIEGRIYTGWQIIDDIPHEARLERIGLDFGYTNDPTAITACYYYNGGYIFDEILYQKGLSNKQIADSLSNQKRVLVIADSAEPKSIDEIKSYGVMIMGVVKKHGGNGENFQKWIINNVQEQSISVTKRSPNIIKEYRNYLWQVDKNGKILNVPEHEWSHSMKAIEYAMSTITNIIRRKEMIEMMPIFERKPRVNPAV